MINQVGLATSPPQDMLGITVPSTPRSPHAELSEVRQIGAQLKRVSKATNEASFFIRFQIINGTLLIQLAFRNVQLISGPGRCCLKLYPAVLLDFYSTGGGKSVHQLQVNAHCKEAVSSSQMVL